MYVKVALLPQLIQNQLKARGFNKHDICMEAKDNYTLNNSSGDGMRAYTDIIDLSGNQSVQTNTGSWGGANIFSPNNKVDLGNESYKITELLVVIKGHEGYKPYATLYVHPTFAQAYNTGTQEVTSEEKEVLEIFAKYKASYRKEYLDRKKFNTSAVIEGLISKKMIKRNIAGSLSLTTEGRNAVR